MTNSPGRTVYLPSNQFRPDHRLVQLMALGTSLGNVIQVTGFSPDGIHGDQQYSIAQLPAGERIFQVPVAIGDLAEIPARAALSSAFMSLGIDPVKLRQAVDASIDGFRS